MTITVATRPGTASIQAEGRLANAIWALRQYIADRHRPGDQLAPARDIARDLTLPYAQLKVALLHLDTAGEIAWGRGHRYRAEILAPGQPHPRDADLVKEVRSRVRSGHYAPGQALPTGLLGRTHGLATKQVDRAFRHLIADGTLRHHEHGPYGPGYYVPKA